MKKKMLLFVIVLLLPFILFGCDEEENAKFQNILNNNKDNIYLSEEDTELISNKIEEINNLINSFVETQKDYEEKKIEYDNKIAELENEISLLKEKANNPNVKDTQVIDIDYFIGKNYEIELDDFTIMVYVYNQDLTTVYKGNLYGDYDNIGINLNINILEGDARIKTFDLLLDNEKVPFAVNYNSRHLVYSGYTYNLSNDYFRYGSGRKVLTHIVDISDYTLKIVCYNGNKYELKLNFKIPDDFTILTE